MVSSDYFGGSFAHHSEVLLSPCRLAGFRPLTFAQLTSDVPAASSWTISARVSLMFSGCLFQHPPENRVELSFLGFHVSCSTANERLAVSLDQLVTSSSILVDLESSCR